MPEYSRDTIREIEEKWRSAWEQSGLYKVSEDPGRPKYYVLDMFPYPSGAGLHVGHPLGYIASDIVARYKRLKGFNVLHPMGFDAFGLPAEQYAIQTGQHPAITTRNNIATYKRQLRQIGFSFDWSREVQTSDPSFYKWTQWIFMQLFNSWYDLSGEGTTKPIDELIRSFETSGNAHVHAACDEDTPVFTASAWKQFDEKEKEELLQKYRIAYRSETIVNWCPALGTVLSNDEVKDGVSERGGYPVERIRMWQWSMRISAYAERLLNGLDVIDWPEPLKEMQRNWIGKSIGAELSFKVMNSTLSIPVFTTRIDTIFGVTFVVVAPEHEIVPQLTTVEQKAEVEAYVEVAKNRSERERMSEVKRVSGVFTGSYVEHPLTGKGVPVWIADYVLAGYGTGAVMAVPSNDTRDYAFAKHFDLEIVPILEGRMSDITADNFEPKSGTMINSDFLNGLPWDKAVEAALKEFERRGIGKRKINYRMRDAIFGRQRYWGEPFPVYYDNGISRLVAEQDLPVTLPEIDEYKPTATGEPPLGRAKDWMYHRRLTPNPSPKERGFATASKKHWAILKQFSKENRKSSTEGERILWEAVRNNKLGYKIRRQHAIETFIADFVCLAKQLVIEIDGEYHEINKEYDEARTEVLKHAGFNLIRFTNEEVTKDLPSVISKIKDALDHSPSPEEMSGSNSPSPSERGQGGEAFPFELTTMPGWAGSSWYWYRYMDPHNDKEFCNRKIQHYWKDVDLYIGGSEHATGHLLYSRFWNKALKDLGYVDAEEPFRKLINQGHIQGVSKFAYRINGTSRFVSAGLKDKYEVTPIHVDVSMVTNDELDMESFRNWRDDLHDADFILEDGKYLCGSEVEKMSKSKHNVVNPDDIVNTYGADTLRMYEMFLGPIELSKPWNTNGIDGVYKFLRRFWNLFHDSKLQCFVGEETPSEEELRILHRTLRKIAEDIERYSFNTAVSEFMICTNELASLSCNKRQILEPLTIALAPFAPHITEELWELLGHRESVHKASFPEFDPRYLVTNSFEYPISINGKVRTKMEFALDMPREDIEKLVLASDTVLKWTAGKKPRKVIIVPGRIVNVVV